MEEKFEEIKDELQRTPEEMAEDTKDFLNSFEILAENLKDGVFDE